MRVKWYVYGGNILSLWEWSRKVIRLHNPVNLKCLIVINYIINYNSLMFKILIISTLLFPYLESSCVSSRSVVTGYKHVVPLGIELSASEAGMLTATLWNQHHCWYVDFSLKPIALMSRGAECVGTMPCSMPLSGPGDWWIWTCDLPGTSVLP